MTLGLALAACGPNVETPGGGDSEGSSGDASGTSPSTGADATGTTATTATTANPTADPTADPTVDSSTGDSDDTNDASGGFYGLPFDFGDGFDCSIESQDCPDGEKCMPWDNTGGSGWNATKCAPLDPNPGAEGDSCLVEGSGSSGVDTCDIGLLCFGVDDTTNEGECRTLCSGSLLLECQDAGDECISIGEGTLELCLAPCDPLDPMCGPTEGCYDLLGGTYGCAPDGSGAFGGYGDRCSYPTDCDPGRICVASIHVPSCIGDYCCTDFCDPAAAVVCPEDGAGQICDDLGAGVGACMVPN